jgi:hypothetical protein
MEQSGVGGVQAVDTYRKALATAASTTAYAVMASSMAHELLPPDPRTMPRLGITLARSRDGDGRTSWRKVPFLKP